MKWGLFILLFCIYMSVNAEDSTYTHIKGFSEFTFNRQSVSGDIQGYEWQPYSNRNNRTNLRIDASSGNDLYFSGNIISDNTTFQEGTYSFSVRHRIGMAKIGQFSPETDILPDKTVMKGVLLKGNYGNNEVIGQYFYNNIGFISENIAGNETQGPFKLKYTEIINGSEEVNLMDEQGVKRKLKRNTDYKINYNAGEIELTKRILESDELLVVKYEIKNNKQYVVKDGTYLYRDGRFNISASALRESVSDNGVTENNDNLSISGLYHNDDLSCNLGIGRSFADSTLPIYIAGGLNYTKNGFNIDAEFKRKDEKYSLFDNAEQLNYGFQLGYSNDRVVMKGNYNNSFGDSIHTKRMGLESGVRSGSNIISYNFLNLQTEKYASIKHFLKLSSDFTLGRVDVLSGIGKMKGDSIGNRNYFVNGVIDIHKSGSIKVNSENRYEVYRDSGSYRYKQYISVAKNIGKSGLFFNLGILNDEMKRNIPFGESRTNINIKDFINIALNSKVKRINGKKDSVETPVNCFEILPKIVFNSKYFNFSYNPWLYYGVYGDNEIQRKNIRNGGNAAGEFDRVRLNAEYYCYSNVDFALNDLKNKKTDNYGITGKLGLTVNVLSHFSVKYGFSYNKDNGLYRTIIPTVTDTSGDTLEIIKISKRIRHDISMAFKRGKSDLNLKAGYERDGEYHSDTLYQKYGMFDGVVEAGKSFFKGLKLYAGVYSNAKRGFDAEIAQDSGWSYSVGPLLRAEYVGKYGTFYSDYKYVQSFGASNAKINELKLGGNLRIKMLGISADCFMRNGLIPAYNVKRISGKVGIYY